MFAIAEACKNRVPEEESTEKPNILWIVSEDNSPWIGAYGDSLADTPNLDKLAKNGILFTNAYSNAPVCAPSRSTLITGMYANGLGTQHMRSTYSIPDSIKFYPEFLREAGYYTSNNFKKDYNTIDRPEAWNESSKTASYKNRKEGQPFFHIQNLTISHESKLHRDSIPKTNPDDVTLYPYHPDTPEMRKDYAVYYDRMHDLDTQIGKILDELEKEGLAENTIVFYYSDHGGPVAATKRFATQQGLHVPLIVRVPKKFEYLTKYENGTSVDRPVGFIDFPPELTHLAGIDTPEQFQGQPFLNPKNDKNLVFGFADRMDESINIVRTVTDGKYRYTRNYLPQQPYGTHIQTLWKAPGMRSWHQEFLNDRTNKIQSAFFEPRAFHELYDIQNDPFQTRNLVNDSVYLEDFARLEKALVAWQMDIRDTGFIPEAQMQELDKDGHIYTFTQSNDYQFSSIYDIASNGMSGATEQEFLEKQLVFETATLQGLTDPLVKFWYFNALAQYQMLSDESINNLLFYMNNEPAYNKIVIAEILHTSGKTETAYDIFLKQLDDSDVMNRVQALNALGRLEKVPLDFREKLEKIAQKRDGKKLPYDARIATYLLDKK